MSVVSLTVNTCRSVGKLLDGQWQEPYAGEWHRVRGDRGYFNPNASLALVVVGGVVWRWVVGWRAPLSGLGGCGCGVLGVLPPLPLLLPCDVLVGARHHTSLDWRFFIIKAANCKCLARRP